MKLQAAITQYYLCSKAEGKRSRKLSSIGTALGLFVSYVGDMDVDALEPDHLRDFIGHEYERASWNKTGPVAAQIILKRYTVLRSFIRWLVYNYRMMADITEFTRPAKIGNSPSTVLDPDEVRKFRQFLKHTGSCRNYSIIRLG